ncbi:MAG TPA: hypothetical protein VGM24_06620 [Puia sp.]
MRQRSISSGTFISATICLFILVTGFNLPRNRFKENLLPEGGSILGIVVPFSVKTTVLAVSVSDTIASTTSDTTNGAYILKDIPPGNYALLYVPSDNQYRKNSTRAVVSEGQITVADTIWLRK